MTLKTIRSAFLTHLSKSFLNRLSPTLGLMTSLVCLNPGNVAAHTNLHPHFFENQSCSTEAKIINQGKRRSKNCFRCVGPRGEEGCPGPRGPHGIGGLSNFAAFEYIADHAPITFSANNPIQFMHQTVLSGNAILSAFPFNTFTLQPGDYQIDIGVSNGTADEFPPVEDLQLLVFLNDVLLFTWPASPKSTDAHTPAFVEFSTIIHVPTSSGTLTIIPSSTIHILPNTGSTVAYINFLKLSPSKKEIMNCAINR